MQPLSDGAFFRKKGRALGIQKPLPGAVAFLQRFGSALQLTPHIQTSRASSSFERQEEGLRRESRCAKTEAVPQAFHAVSGEDC